MWQPGVQGLPATALQRGVEITQVSFPFFLVTSFCKEALSSKHGQELSETMGVTLHHSFGAPQQRASPQS